MTKKKQNSDDNNDLTGLTMVKFHSWHLKSNYNQDGNTCLDTRFNQAYGHGHSFSAFS